MTLCRAPRLTLVVPFLVAALAFALTGCGAPAARGSWQALPSSSASQGAAAAQGAPGVSSVNWSDCKGRTERSIGSTLSGVKVDCGTIAVPGDWAQPNVGKKIDVAMIRVRREQQHDRVGSLIVNPGGPGASGVQLAAQAPLFLPGEILERFDIVGFDPRGVGESSPISCLSDRSKDDITAADPDPRAQTAFDQQVNIWRTAVSPCGSRYGATIGEYNTEQTARDMDAVRAAVGDSKINYLGYSYGTLLGAVYAHLFPTKIRAFVLDGAVDPNLDGAQASEGQAAGFEEAFNAFATGCKNRGTACSIGPDARATLNEVLAKVAANPVRGKGADTRLATTGHVLSAVTAALYVESQWQQLETAISNISKGDPTGIFELSDDFAGRRSDGTYNNMTDAFTAIGCADEKNPPTVARVRALQTAWRAKYPLFGGPLAMTLLSCAVWPGAHHPYPVGKATGSPPIVVVGTTGDPATPYANTAKLASLLGTGQVVTWQGEGHTAYPQTACLRENIDRYLLTTTPPPTNLTCPAL